MANLAQTQPLVSTMTYLQSSDPYAQQENEKWDTLLANSEDFLAELADEALIEYRSGKTELLARVGCISEASYTFIFLRNYK